MALLLSVVRGFEATASDDTAAALGIGRRTLFAVTRRRTTSSGASSPRSSIASARSYMQAKLDR